MDQMLLKGGIDDYNTKGPSKSMIYRPFQAEEYKNNDFCPR